MRPLSFFKPITDQFGHHCQVESACCGGGELRSDHSRDSHVLLAGDNLQSGRHAKQHSQASLLLSLYGGDYSEDRGLVPCPGEAAHHRGSLGTAAHLMIPKLVRLLFLLFAIVYIDVRHLSRSFHHSKI